MHKHNNPTSSPWEILGDMGFLETLIRITCVGVILSEFAVAVVGFTYPIAQPNCSDMCGDMKIPYPFGLGEGCYLDHNFFVNCTNSSEPFIAVNMIVTNISLHGYIDTLVYIAHDCYEQARVRWLIMPRTHHTSIRPSISPSLAPKTSLWSLVATLTHTFKVTSKMKDTPPAARPYVKALGSWSMGHALVLGVAR